MPSIVLVPASILQKLIACCTPETARMPSDTHSVDYSPYNCAIANTTYIALQLHQGTVHVPEYNIPAPTNPIVDSPAINAPSASLTQEDMDAVQTLLSLATLE